MLSNEMKNRVYGDALSAEAELIDRDLTVGIVRYWLEVADETIISNVFDLYKAQDKETLSINRAMYHERLGLMLCAYLDKCVMDAAAEQLEGKIDEIYAEAEK